MKIPKKIKDEIWEYCRLNNITDVDGFIQKMLKQGFTVEKFGSTPNERIVEKEVEKIVEIPIEVIKEVEKIVEVPVEVIKEVKITDNEETNKLLLELEVVKNDEKTHKKDLRSAVKERDELREQVNELIKTVQLQRQDSVKIDNILVDKNKEMLKLITELEEVKKELEIEKNKPKETPKKDIYGERGTFGSNISDL